MDDWKLETEKIELKRPGHILFLCVANSARSQMAEGIASHFAPPGISISSAGSQPTSVRPEAVAVLEEIGIDIAGQFSKGIDAVDRQSVDTVITLCAEEACPFFPGKVQRLHWGLPDPAAVEGDRDARFEAFRQVRDELIRRIRFVFEK